MRHTPRDLDTDPQPTPKYFPPGPLAYRLQHEVQEEYSPLYVGTEHFKAPIRGGTSLVDEDLYCGVRGLSFPFDLKDHMVFDWEEPLHVSNHQISSKKILDELGIKPGTISIPSTFSVLYARFNPVRYYVLSLGHMFSTTKAIGDDKEQLIDEYLPSVMKYGLMCGFAAASFESTIYIAAFYLYW